MCSIIGSFSKEKFKELVELNQHRGDFSYSLLVLDPISSKALQKKQGFGKFPVDIIDDAMDNKYYLGHTQAPTNGLIEDSSKIHPATMYKNYETYLFHNGVIKQKDVVRLQDEHDSHSSWDSQLMITDITIKGLMSSLNSLDGSFACVYREPGLLSIFRSAAGILFTDADLNISSTKFKGAERILKDTVYAVDLIKKCISPEFEFTSKSNPYFIA